MPKQAETKTAPGGKPGAASGAGEAAYPPSIHPLADRRPIMAGNIPLEMQAERRWVVWSYQGRGKKKTKIPRQVGGAKADTTDPDTWTDYEIALKASPRFDGLGFVLGDGWLGVDLDHCYTPDGALSELAASVVTNINSYTESSPSGSGLHIIARVLELPGEDIPSNPTGVEMYSTERYFTMTGNHLEGTPLTVESRDAEAAAVYVEIQELRLPPNPFTELVLPAAAMAGLVPAPADWITQDFIERDDLVLFTGIPGSMKSLYLLCWAARQAMGRRWLTRPDGTGGLETKATGVLWLNADNSDRTHKERLLAVLRTLGRFDIPLYSVTTTDFDLTRPDHVNWIRDVAEDCGAEVLVLDTISGCLPGVDENSAQEMNTPAGNLRSLSNAGLAVIAVHHPPKNDVNGSRGSSVLAGKVDRHYVLARNDDLLTVKSPKTRGRGHTLPVAIASIDSDPTTEALNGLAFFDGRSAAHDRAGAAAEQAILDALDPGPLNARALRTKVKGAKDMVKDALIALVASGQVKTTAGPNRQVIYERTHG